MNPQPSDSASGEPTGRYPSAKVAPWDRRWLLGYLALADRLIRGLGAGWLVEHVGSTSVPLLPGKPVIDVALRMPPGVELQDVAGIFAPLGWAGPEVVGDHAALFLLDQGVRRSIVHLYTAEQWPTAHIRLFAQWLRVHPRDREAYAALKTSLVGAGVWGAGYTDAKTAFVLGVVNRARLASGLDAVCDLDERRCPNG